MKKAIGTALAAGAAVLGATAATTATASAEAAWSFNVGLANEYVFRGIDQTTSDEGDGQAFAGADLAVDSFYAGVWVSSMGSSYDPGTEYDLYAGWKPALGGVNLDLGAIFYGYLDGDTTDYSEANALELKAAASIPLGSATLGAAVYYQPDFAGDADSLDNAGFYYEVNGSYAFENKVVLSGAIGAVDVEDYVNDSYTTANVGITLPVTDNLSVDGRYHMTDEDAESFAGAQESASRLVATIKATF